MIELVVVLAVLAILMAISVPVFFGQTSLSHDRSAQSLLDQALSASNRVYDATQDYPQITAPELNRADTSAKFTANGTLTSFNPSAVVFATGSLSDGDAGGWIGLASLAQSGTCWQVYQPADGSPTYGSATSGTCSAPTGPLNASRWP